MSFPEFIWPEEDVSLQGKKPLLLALPVLRTPWSTRSCGQLRQREKGWAPLALGPQEALHNKKGGVFLQLLEDTFMYVP